MGHQGLGTPSFTSKMSHGHLGLAMISAVLHCSSKYNAVNKWYHHVTIFTMCKLFSVVHVLWWISLNHRECKKYLPPPPPPPASSSSSSSSSSPSSSSFIFSRDHMINIVILEPRFGWVFASSQPSFKARTWWEALATSSMCLGSCDGSAWRTSSDKLWGYTDGASQYVCTYCMLHNMYNYICVYTCRYI